MSKYTLTQTQTVAFPVPTDIINQLIEICSGECQCADGGGNWNRKCYGCKKLVCNNCEMFWMKCTGEWNGSICIHLSGNKYCYGCVKEWRKAGTMCHFCCKKPTFFLI
jgi:hypothetical protein